MKIKNLIALLLVLSCNALNAMEQDSNDKIAPFFLDKSNQFNGFDTIEVSKPTIIQHAELLVEDYKKLSEYLYKEFENTESDFIVLYSLTLSGWILEQARKKGNVVCAYFLIRNYLKQVGHVRTATEIVSDQEYAICLEMILLCLQRVAYDIVQYYKKTKDASVFNTYAIFKQKIYYLLKAYFSKVPHPDHYLENLEKKDNSNPYGPSLDFPTICKKSIEHWKHHQWYNLLHYNTWVSVFSWTHGWTPYSYGICFGAEPSVETNDQQESTPDHTTLAIALNIFALVGVGKEKETKITTIIYSGLDGYADSWEKFFQSYTFPLTKEALDRQLELAEQNSWTFE